MDPVAILIPAAGFGTRMRGADKLLQDVGGLPLIRRQAQRALAAGDHVVVTLPSTDSPRAQALSGLPIRMVEVPDAADGMAASIRRGVASLPRACAAVVVAPGDMPDLTEDDFTSVIKGFRAMPQATLQQGTAEDGTPGHPVLFPADCFVALRQITGDQGARDILRANSHRLRRVALPGRNALTDLDTPEAWEAWRAENAVG
ncbi:nucleotidyltransferase family protein [Thalassococcus profundi]|uniref:Nucleotidyltransferase family protein n=1 Tax=Thalassococcus profundi TaxID=2282382 RepID=A0A369TPZ9_9RHOB|nr:nucleotidyltransferase family protein [Thalassococcus profundi]RDD66774.1 nucleotidyltransferase family protein [Thalassococcus profundi]